MSDFFTEVFPNLFRIKVPLPGSPLHYLNSYVVRGTDRNLIVDTGYNSKICYDAIITALNCLEIDLNHTDIFVTHFHADHFGLVSKLKVSNTRVFFNRPEAELLKNWQGFGELMNKAKGHGLALAKLQKIFDDHPGSKFGIKWASEAKTLSDGQTLSYGNYTFTCIETPGHTPGHMCLYESNRKILISGDHILKEITPNIQCWHDDENPLKLYLRSLKRLRSFDVGLILPGHRPLFENMESRISELLSHHEHRFNEIKNILDENPKTAFETASKMKWDIQAPSWEEVPIVQQWFATGEALSHLRYLEVQREIIRRSTDEIVKFELR